MDELIDAGVPDFVVTLQIEPQTPEEFEGYEIVRSFSSDYGQPEGVTAYFTLYQRAGTEAA